MEEHKSIPQDEIFDALDHYCALCKRGFKTKGARNAHNAIKHKYASNPTPDKKLC